LQEKEQRVVELQEHLGAQGPYSESLDVLFGAVYGFNESYLNRAPFEVLKSRGLGLISNESLRVQIIRVYAEDYEQVDRVDARHRRFAIDLYRPYFLVQFVETNFNNSATPIDYGALLRDQYFLNLVDYRLAVLRSDTIPAYDAALTSIRNLLSSLEIEIERTGR